MQADKLEKNVGVAPVEFIELDRKEFLLKYTSEIDDLIVQVFPKDTDILRNAPVMEIGARVAKAIVDTIGEDNMHTAKIEVHSDPMIGGTSCYARLVGKGAEITRDLTVPVLAARLQESLAATQA